jgi:hypothetical protein
MKKTCLSIIAALVIVLGGVIYMFGLRGQVRMSDDGRTAILLSAGERDLMLSEMRGFLEAVQEIAEALPENDTKTISEAALRVGRVDLKDVPASLLRKLPGEVKRLGLDTHYKFYQLGKDVQNGLARDKILPRLAGIMTNCVGCHAGYRLDLEGGKK